MFKIKSVEINSTGNYLKANGYSNLYRVYKNSQAKDLFMKAKKAKTSQEREKLFIEMGEYKLVTETEKKYGRGRLLQFLKGLLSGF